MKKSWKVLEFVVVFLIATIIGLWKENIIALSTKPKKKTEKQKAKAEKIKEWLPDYIEKHFCSEDDFGHMPQKHLNKDDEYLKDRLSKERIRISSSFCGDEKEIVGMLRNTMTENIPWIADYLSNDKRTQNLEIHGILPKSVKGRGYRKISRQNCKQEDLSGFVVVIGKSQKKESFVVKTAYPTKRKVAKKKKRS